MPPSNVGGRICQLVCGAGGGRWRALAGLVGLVALMGGCLTASDQILFTTSGAEWTVRQGQVIWKPGRSHPELAGEIVLAQNADGRCSLQFTKTLLPVAFVQTTTNRWLIQFPPQKIGFSGSGQPPARLLWLQLPAALDGEPLPSGVTFTHRADGGWRLANARTGEFVEGFLSP